MAGDAKLTEVLAAARRDLPDVPDEVWQQFETYLRVQFGATRVYVEARRKRYQLQAAEILGDDVAPSRLAEILGVSVRQARRIKGLR